MYMEEPQHLNLDLTSPMPAIIEEDDEPVITSKNMLKRYTVISD